MSPAKSNDSKKKKKHNTVTPETPPSPTHSEGKDIIDVLNDPVIQGYAIKEEELQKLRDSLRSKQQWQDKQANAKKQHVSVKKPSVVRKPKTVRHVTIARLAPDNVKLKDVDYGGPAGPKYTTDGRIVDYSLLGTVEDFVEEAVKHQQISPDSAAVKARRTTFQQLNVTSFERPQTVVDDGAKKSFNQSHSLQRWEAHMRERKIQQNYISQVTNKPVDQLAMNRGHQFRSKRETQALIRHVAPYYLSERLYRDGVEFWNQPDTIGDENEGGLRLTAPRSERGYPFVNEHIKTPHTIQKETGMTDDWHDSLDAGKFHNSPYVKRRLLQLKPDIREVDSITPDLDNLEVVVKSAANRNSSRVNTEDTRSDRTSLNTSCRANESANESAGPLDKYPDLIPKMFDGPSIVFNGHQARWTGSSDDQADEIGLVTRMNFDSAIKSRDVMKLEVENNGTTAIHYEWSKIPTPSKFENIISDNIQRFYFNVGNGVILPGDVAVLPFTFKSPNAGIFYEKWRFSTQPVVMGGASVLLILKGVATQEALQNEIKKNCDAIEARLLKREAEVICDRMMYDIIRGVQTPERSPSPVDAHMTEQDIFERLNPELFYKFEAVTKLKRKYTDHIVKKIAGNNRLPEWNLSVDDLRSYARCIDNVDKRESMLDGINKVVNEMLAIPIILSRTQIKYDNTLATLQLFFDEMASCSMHLRSVLGLPLPISDSVSSFGRGSTIGDREISPTMTEDSKVSDKNKKKNPKDVKKSATKKLAEMPKRRRSNDGSSSSRNSSARRANSPGLVSNDGNWSGDEKLNIDDDVDTVSYEKYKEKFRLLTRELLVESLDRIFGFYETN